MILSFLKPGSWVVDPDLPKGLFVRSAQASIVGHGGRLVPVDLVTRFENPELYEGTSSWQVIIRGYEYPRDIPGQYLEIDVGFMKIALMYTMSPNHWIVAPAGEVPHEPVIYVPEFDPKWTYSNA